jgi:hypothetical protein
MLLTTEIYRAFDLHKAVPLRNSDAKGKRTYGSYSFSTSALYPREKKSGTHCTGGWMGPRARLDTEATGKIL